MAVGIAASQDNPGRFFYDNAIMGLQLIEQARVAGVKKFVAAGTTCWPATLKKRTRPTGWRRR